MSEPLTETLPEWVRESDEWVNTLTGEVVPVEHEPEDFSGIPGWLAEQALKDQLAADALSAEVRALTDQLAKRIRTIRLREKCRLWRWKPIAMDEVKKDIAAAGGKKKSHHYTYGTLGFRTSKRTNVTDEKAAIDWAKDNDCMAAIKFPEPKLLKSALPKGEDIPGIERVTETTFFIKPAAAK